MNAHTDDLLAFLDASPCNFLAVDSLRRRLEDAGFSEIKMADAWQLSAGDRRYVVKNDSAIFAFVVGSDPLAGFRVISAHSDSPGFRIKPSCEMVCTGNVLKLNTEVYGGPILYTWFDRPLSLSGRVMLRGASPLEPVSRLLKIDRPLLTIPHLAIHYNRSVNEGNPLSKQRDMLPVMAILADRSAADGLMVNLVARELGVDASEILDYDLTLYDVTPACRFGLDNEFISSGRIDDLMMAHAAVSALTGSLADDREFRATRVMAIFDNEETGSGTRQGAASPVLRSILSRISASYPCAGEDTYLRAVARSFMISADNGHAIHPNYEAKQDPTNHPVLGGGPVVKINANCKYMTDASSAAVFRSICEEAGVRVQTFVNHSDTPGGSTLGNILTSQIDLDGVDMGAPQWAMHSCRETAAVADHLSVIKAFTRFYTL
ncbi:MAG: M18 family aminopeptidase [Muribaculaceae bacterium]|nr:M18 family aminopeptidase [Muribaculaceae bacterium]